MLSNISQKGELLAPLFLCMSHLKKMPLIIVLRLYQEMIIMEILYRGRPFILEDAGDRYRLTSVEKKNGRVTILEFIRRYKRAVRQYRPLLFF